MGQHKKRGRKKGGKNKPKFILPAQGCGQLVPLEQKITIEFLERDCFADCYLFLARRIRVTFYEFMQWCKSRGFLK